VFLVAAALSGASWVAEVDRDAAGDAEPGMFGHFFALVPGDRSTQLLSQRGHGFGERVGNGIDGVAVREPDQHHEPGLPVHQCCDRAVGPAEDQIASRKTERWPGTARSSAAAGRSEMCTTPRS
jgi:hypothetical protein